MSSVARAADLVGRARRRLLARRAAELAVTGAFAAGVCSVCVGLAGAAGWLPAAPLGALVAVLLTGALAGGVLACRRAPDRAAAALAVDRAADAHEAFVSALTATDAAPAMRELSAAYGLTAVGDRSLRALLPFDVPTRAAPAAIVLALTVALAGLGVPDAAASADPTGATGAAAVVAQPGGAQSAGGAAGPDAGAPAPVPGSPAAGRTRSAEAPTPNLDELPALTTEDVRRLAEDLAARGVEAGARALAALAAGDRAAAEDALRQALAARGDGTGPGTADHADDSGARPDTGTAPGRWSVGAWPLRYDREVRAWLRRRVADDGRTHPKGDER